MVLFHRVAVSVAMYNIVRTVERPPIVFLLPTDFPESLFGSATNEVRGLGIEVHRELADLWR